MRVAIYARVSTGEQSPELQLRELREYAGRRNFVVHREYVDQASGDVRRRAPAFDELMADARRRRFDCVLVWKYDRFARSLGALVAALQEFRDLGVDFISHTQAIDTTTPMGRLFFHVIGSFAEFERDVIVERVRAGLANARAKGKRLGRPVRDPGAQTRVVALKGEGLSLRQIAARERLSPSGVRKMLKRAGVETAAPAAAPALGQA
jgi:DNA invertase Pin-like site-specific DNA recombinase